MGALRPLRILQRRTRSTVHDPYYRQVHRAPASRPPFAVGGAVVSHTPGPWKVYHRHERAGPHSDEMAGLGWELEGPPEAMLRGQFAKAADAHLIAAAPDLLAALEAAHDILEDQYEPCEPGCACILHIVEAAIAKARGVAS